MRSFKSYNPFFHLSPENKKYPHARTLRTNLSTKMLDAIEVWTGSDANSPRCHPGLLQYCTLFIFEGFFYLDSFSSSLEKGNDGSNIQDYSSSNSLLSNFLSLISSVISILVRLVFIIIYVEIFAITTLAWSLAALPIVAIVHFLSQIYVGDDKKLALSTEGINENYTSCSLKQFLTSHKLDIEEIEVTEITPKEIDINNNQSIQVTFAENWRCKKKQGCQFTTTLFPDRQSLSLFKLNLGNLEHFCEENKPDSYLINMGAQFNA